MKNLVFMFSLLVVVIINTSCSSDDDQIELDLPENHIVINDEVFELQSGIMINHGNIIGDHYNFDISLFDQAFDPSQGNNAFGGNNFTGITFELFSTKQTNIKEGLYTYSQNRGSASTFTIAEVVDDCVYSSNSNNCSNTYTVNAGSFTVNLASDTFELEFNVDISGSGYAYGKYSGVLLRNDTDRNTTGNNLMIHSINKELAE